MTPILVLKIDRRLADSLAPLFGLLGVFENNSGWIKIDARERQQKIVNAVVSLLISLSGIKPLLLVIEDLHWADEATRLFIDVLIEKTPHLSIFVMLSYRPEFQPHWKALVCYRELPLERFDNAEALELCTVLLGSSKKLADLKQALIEKAVGNPFYLEEMVQSLDESKTIKGSLGSYTLADKRLQELQLDLPNSIKTSVGIRLDRLAASDKKVLQAASIIGVKFERRVLNEIVDIGDYTLNSIISRLISARYINHEQNDEYHRFSFVHALTHDAVYQSLASDQRSQLHATVGNYLKDSYREFCESNPEVLALHLLKGQCYIDAIEALITAGKRAGEHGLNELAREYLQIGIDSLQHLVEGEERDLYEIRLRVVLGVPILILESGESDQLYENYHRAEILCERQGNKTYLFPIYFGLWLSAMARSQADEVGPIAERLLAISREEKDDARLLEAHHCQWSSKFMIGDLAGCLKHCYEGNRIYDRKHHHGLTYEYGGHNPGTCSLFTGAMALALSGQVDRAIEWARKSIQLSLDLNHGQTLSETWLAAMELGAILHDHSLTEEWLPRFRQQINAAPHFVSSKLIRLGIICLHEAAEPTEESRREIITLAENCLQIMFSWSQPVVALAVDKLNREGNPELAR